MFCVHVYSFAYLDLVGALGGSVVRLPPDAPPCGVLDGRPALGYKVPAGSGEDLLLLILIAPLMRRRIT